MTNTRPPLVATYPDAALIRRLKRIRKLKPRFTISKIVERCIERELPNIEAELGLSRGGANHDQSTGR